MTTTTLTPPRQTSIRIRWRDLELPTRIQFERATLTPSFGRVIAEPFERGYGTTIGNSLRRVLLSSLEGAAVSHIHIKGVAHEFMAIPGIYEDVSQIILNLKKLLVRFTIDTADPVELRLHATKPGIVTGADIAADHRVEVVSKDQKICEITEKTDFDLRMTVRPGRGYVAATEHDDEDQVIGVIPIDSIYSPVTRVRYRTEDTRVGKITNYDKLILEIWTNGTISPEMALVEAAKILRKHLNPFIQNVTLGEELQGEAQPEAADTTGSAVDPHALAEKLTAPIGTLELSVRASNCIEAENIKTVGDLCRRTEEEMLEVRNFGKTSLTEVKKKLTALGLTLGMDVDEILGTESAE